MSSLATFVINGMPAPAGAMLRCRITNGDSQASGNHYKGSNVVELALTETTLANNSGFSDYNGAAQAMINDSISLPCNFEVRQVSAQTTVAFDDAGSNGAAIVASCGVFGYASAGNWIVPTNSGGNASAGNGAYPVYITVSDTNSAALGNAMVRGMGSGVNGFAYTDASGRATLALNAGLNTITATIGGYASYAGTVNLSGTMSLPLTLSPLTINPPAAPGMTFGVGVAYDANLSTSQGVNFRFQLMPGTNSLAGSSYPGEYEYATSQSDGTFSKLLLQSQPYRVWRETSVTNKWGPMVTFTAGDSTNDTQLPEILGQPVD